MKLPQVTAGDPAVGVKIAGWIERLLGGRATRWNRLVSGNSRSTWSVDVERPDGPVAVVVRVDEGNGPYSGTPLTLGREAVAYRGLDGHGVAIPSFYGFDEELGALAMARVPGEPRWDEEVLAATLAEARKLHALDVDGLDLPGFRRSALGDVELWAAIARERITPSSPFIDLAVDLLRKHFPGEPDRLAFIHGDLGIGNVLWHEGKLSGLLDWELSHIGDPHDELAFITVRAALHGIEIPGFGDAVRRYYAGADGSGLDPTRLAYWQAVGVLRNLVTCLSSISNPVTGRDRLVHFMLVPSLQRLLIGLLAEIADVALPEPEDIEAPPELPGQALMTEMSREIAALPDAVPDPDQSQRARRVRYLFGQLAETWPLATVIAERAAAEPPADDDGERLRQLTRVADRELAMFPRARPIAYARLATLD